MEGSRQQSRPASWLRSVVATVVSNLFLVLGTILFGTLTLVGALLLPRCGVYRWIRLWSSGLLRASGARVDVRMPEEPLHGPAVIMANHQSLLDIPLLIRSWPGEVRFLAKRSLFSIPVFGWALRASGFVPVDRKDRKSAPETLKAARSLIERGISVVVFPEETRSRDGRLLPFKRGGFLLALKCRAPIVPVGLRGTREMRRPGGLLVTPGALEAHFGTPVEVAGGLRAKGDLIANVRDRVQSLAQIPELPETVP